MSVLRLVVLACALLAPASAVAEEPSPELVEALKDAGLTLADLEPGTRDPMDRGVGAAPRWRLASVDGLLGSPLTFGPWAEERAKRLARDLPGMGGLPSWDGFFGVAMQELRLGEWIDPCSDGARPALGLIDHHVAWESERDVRLSRREVKALREAISPALDVRIGRLVDEADLARCRLDAVLAPLDAAGREVVVLAIEALLAGVPPGTFEAQEVVTALTDAWDAIDGAGLLAAGQAWSDVVGRATVELSAVPEIDWPVRPAIFSTRHGEVWIGTAGHNSGTGDPFVIVDPGGDDVWRIEPERASLPREGARPVRAWIDLGGDDLWQGGAASVGGALLSVSAGVDVAGDDTWRLGDLSGGAAAFGVATWLDGGGADVRVVAVGGQGFATFGAAAVRDRGREGDVWEAIDLAQGAALPLGFGLVHDQGGDDRFAVAGRALAAPAHSGLTMTGGQGVSLGLEPLIGGGLGWLQDDGGDDAMLALGQAQGACSGEGIGVAWDGSGDDLWRVAELLGQGVAGSRCVAGLFDELGDDLYAGGDLVQALGSGRSVALLRDGAGNDRYEGAWGGQGVAGLYSVAMLLDGGGSDRFTADPWTQGEPSGLDDQGPAALLDVGGGDEGLWVASATIGQGDGPVAPPPRTVTLEGAVERLRAGSSGWGTPQATSRDLETLGLDGLEVLLPALSEDRPAEVWIVQTIVFDLLLRSDLGDARTLAGLLADDALTRERTVADGTARWHLTWLKMIAAQAPAAATEELLRAVEELADHPAWPVRQAALCAYATLASSELVIDPADLQAWEARAAIALQNEARPEVRAVAIDGLSVYGGPGVAGLLAEALAGETWPVRELAEDALSQITPRSDGLAVARAVFPLASGDAVVSLPVREAALRLLGATGHREAWDVLEPALTDPEPRIRIAAVIGARRLGGRQAERALAERRELETNMAVQLVLREE